MFSVVVPTYNRATRVMPTLKSVAAQSNTDFECIVVDDGSEDGEYLESVVRSMNDDRFRYVRQENGGASRARNLGFDLARGKFVALLDSDDLFLENKLAEAALAISDCTADLLVYSQMLIDRGLEKKWIQPSRGLLSGERVDEYLLCTSGTIRTSTVVVSASLARRVRFDESLPSLQDTDFAIRIAGTGARILYIDEPLVVFNDKISATRVSRNANYKPLIEWLDRMRIDTMSERAYWAGRGSHCARVASYSRRTYGIRLFAGAAVRGVFPLRQAMRLAAQVTIPYSVYQKLSNVIVRLLGKSA